MRIIITLCAFLVSAPAWAISWGDSCKYSKEIDQELDLSGSESLEIYALAGDLEVTGGSKGTARITGKACTPKEKWLDDAVVNTEGGREAAIRVGVASNSNSSIDLKITVPDSIALSIRDSSGGIEVSDVASVRLRDSSGDVYLTRISGDVIVDSDSSGDLEGRDIVGSVRIVKDSSGDIEFKDVGKDFIVEKDSSGDIVANGVGGDFQVLRDGSGSVDAHNVSGEVLIED